MRKEDRCIWDKFGKDDIARIAALVERADKVLEEERKKKEDEYGRRVHSVIDR